MAKTTVKFTFTKPDGTFSTFSKYRAFLAAIRRDLLPESKISVSYGRGLTNSGTFSDYNAAAKFIKECTEQPLLDYIAGGKW